MMDRVIEIVNFVMKKVLNQGENAYSEQSLVGALVQLGYNPEEIRIAFKFLQALSGTVKLNPVLLGEIREVRQGQRVFSPAERGKLTPSFQNELLRLSNCFLTTEETELVMIEAMQSDKEELGLKELELILHKVIRDEERLLMICPQSLTQIPVFLLN